MIRQVDRDTWIRLAPEFSDYNYRQTWDFGIACAERVGGVSEHVAIEIRGQIVALADVRIRKLPVINVGFAYINGGPLVWKEGASQERIEFSAVVNALSEEYVVRRKLTLRIAPAVNGDPGKNYLENTLIQKGFIGQREKRKTIFLDLASDVMTIRKNFHQKWRGHLSRSEKNGLAVHIGKDWAMMQDFIPLYNELIAEKNFAVDLSINFYANVQKRADAGNKFIILLAKHEGKVVAGHIVSILGNTCVTILRTVNHIGRDLKAAYLLYWKAILLSKEAGCRWYDLGGIASTENPGVYSFKKRLGGQERTLPGPYQINPVGFRAELAQWGEKVYVALNPSKLQALVSSIFSSVTKKSELSSSLLCPESPCSIQQVNRDTWLRLAPGFSDYNYNQAWDFGVACAARIGGVSEHVAIEIAEQRVALADVRIRRLPVIGGGIAYINSGPLVREKDGVHEQIVLSTVLNALVGEYVVRRNFTLRINPSSRGDSDGNVLEKVLILNGFILLPQQKKTIILNLSREEATIRSNFHQKWRNCLSKSEKAGVTVRAGKDPAIFQEFIPLFSKLITEKNFSVDLDIDFYSSVQRVAVEGEKFFVMLAEKDGEVIAGHVASILGDTCVYLLGASSNTGRKMNAAYLLQWKAIQLGKAEGCRWYDLGGIEPEGNPGVYKFKKRMGGQEITQPGPYQIQPKGAKALLTLLGEKVYTVLKPYLVRK